MKRYLRRVVVFLVLAAFGAGTYLVGRTLWRQRQSDLARVAVEMLPNVAQRIQNFHRVKVRNGEKKWEVSAEEANYYEENSVVAVTAPVVSFFGSDGRVVAMRGKEGKVHVGDNELRGVELSGQIQVDVDGYTLNTEWANYEGDTDTITSPGKVRIAGHNLEINGKQMTIDLAGRRMTLKDNVQMVMQPNA